MDWLKNFLNKYHLGFIGFVMSMVSVTFILNLIQSAQDGIITDVEFHNLSAHANGVELLILAIVMIVLKKRT